MKYLIALGIIIVLLYSAARADLTFNWVPPELVDGVTETGYDLYCDDVFLASIDGVSTTRYVEPSTSGKVADGTHSCDMETLGTEDEYGSVVSSVRSAPVEFESINGSLVLIKPNATTGLFMTVN